MTQQQTVATAVEGGETRDSSSASQEIGRWRLTELLPDDHDSTLDQRLSELESLVVSFESRRSDLEEIFGADGGLDEETLIQIVGDYERLVVAVSRLAAYGELSFAADTRCSKAIALRNRLQQRITDLRNRTLFFGLWWQEVPEDRAGEVLARLDARSATSDQVRPRAADQVRPRAADQACFLRDLRRLAPFRLDERSEKIVNLKDADGISGILTLYSMVTNSFEFRSPADGVQAGSDAEERGLTRDELMTYVHSDDPEQRAASYRELFRVYRANAPWLSQMYLHRVRDWHSENVTLRGYQSAISVRNTANDVSDQAVATLLQVVREKAPIFRRYFERKAEWLGLDKLRRYDIYAPLRRSSETVPYGEGVDLVLDTFSAFDPKLGELAQRVFQQGHVDSEARPGKKGGAFCATVSPDLTPWVLVNYSGRPRDVAILAHELGHAVHSMLASEHSVLTQQPSLPMAETASVFGELLVTTRLLEQASDPLLRRELLASALDDIYATVLRQAYFVLFEIDAHQALIEGGSPEVLGDIYRANLEEQFGGSVELAPEFSQEWLAIPHIYSTPFYCYSYSFGQLLVLALYRRYLEQGDRFKPGYLELLAYGGSAPPAEILLGIGIDIEDAEFWRGGFDVVETFLDQLEQTA